MEDAARLTEIANAAKAMWGYPPQALAAWRPDLAISVHEIGARPFFVAEESGDILGFASLQPSPQAWELDNLWVAPGAMRQGVGSALFAHALAVAAAAHASEIVIDADPNAEVFYLACGARRVGEVAAPIKGQPDRVRPQFSVHVGGTAHKKNPA